MRDVESISDRRNGVFWVWRHQVWQLWGPVNPKGQECGGGVRRARGFAAVPQKGRLTCRAGPQPEGTLWGQSLDTGEPYGDTGHARGDGGLPWPEEAPAGVVVRVTVQPLVGSGQASVCHYCLASQCQGPSAAQDQDKDPGGSLLCLPAQLGSERVGAGARACSATWDSTSRARCPGICALEQSGGPCWSRSTPLRLRCGWLISGGDLPHPGPAGGGECWRWGRHWGLMTT